MKCTFLLLLLSIVSFYKVINAWVFFYICWYEFVQKSFFFLWVLVLSHSCFLTLDVIPTLLAEIARSGF